MGGPAGVRGVFKFLVLSTLAAQGACGEWALAQTLAASRPTEALPLLDVYYRCVADQAKAARRALHQDASVEALLDAGQSQCAGPYGKPSMRLPPRVSGK
jgi:hypothetical protein